MRVIAAFVLLVGTIAPGPLVQTTSTTDRANVTASEREALIALYNATSGSTWAHHQGWLGPHGTECQWYGVVCGREDRKQPAGNMTILEVNLGNNSLTGQLPNEISMLRGLRRLDLSGSTVRGPLPDELLQMWDDGELQINPRSLVSDVDEILVDQNNSALICFGYRAKFASDGGVQLENRRCRENGSRTAELFCEQKVGKTNDFIRLGRLLDRSGFFAKMPHDTPRETDTPETTITAKRANQGRVSHTLNGSIQDWSLGMIINGLLDRVEWTGTPTRIPCSTR